MSEEIKFDNPTDLLEKVKSHGGKVFETLYYWQRFDRDNNIRILEEVIEYVERNDQQVFEVTWDGLTNIPDSVVPFVLPRDVKLNARSVRWFRENTLESLNENLAWIRKAKTPYERGQAEIQEDCKNCRWVGYCGGHYEYICHLRRSIILEYADRLGIEVIDNWFIDPELCEFYVKSQKSEEEIRQTGSGEASI